MAVKSGETKKDELENPPGEREQSRMLLDGIRLECPIPQFIIDRSHRVVFWNRALEKYTGIKAESILGTTGQWRAFYPSERPILADLLVDGAFNEIPRWYPGKFSKSRLIEEAYEATDFFPQVSGGIWLYFTAAPIRDSGGNIQGAIETLEDVTERKRMEASLRRNENLLTEGERIANWGSWDWDIEHDRIFCSRGLELILGLLPGCPTSMAVIERDVICPGYRKIFQDSVSKAIREDTVVDCEINVIKQDGSDEVRTIQVRGTIRKDEQGRPLLMIGTGQDITERKHSEEALANAKAQAELYLDLMSHDINNMNQIAIGYLEMALNVVKLKKEEQELLLKPLEAIWGSSDLIENIKKLQKSRTEKQELGSVDLCKALSRIRQRYLKVHGRDVTINLHLIPNCVVIANDLMMDIFSNLVGNAVKHSDPGVPLIVNVNAGRAVRDGKEYVEVSIEDNGPGIPDEQKSRLLRGYKTDPAKTAGRGLGLYLVKTLVDLFHGKVRLEDRVPGDHAQGSRFVVMLPAAK
jgi:signal transduction histidine kinase